MPTSIDIREIPLFKFFDVTARQALVARFSRHVMAEGQSILTYGMPVPGIYIVVEGKVKISIPDVKDPLAVLERGQCFGEMSLIEEVEYASADATVMTESAKLLFCSIVDFRKNFEEFPGSSDAFYRSSAILLSLRLRQTTQLLNKELSAGQSLLKTLITDPVTGNKITQTKNNVEKTGHTVVNKLMDVIPLLEAIIRKYPVAEQDLNKLRQKIEDVFLVDSQEFDRITQQLGQIEQHFDNIRRVANGGDSLPLAGDRNLFQF